MTIRVLSPSEAAEAVPVLADILIDCVHGGASVGFQAPLARDKAEAFWRNVAAGVADGARILIVAESGARMIGTVQVIFAGPENQPHRADVSKMLVHSGARRQGLGAALLRAAEQQAKMAGRRLLVLDTQTGSGAEALYARQGWTRTGIIPGYALMPYGGLCDTTVFFRQI